MPDLIVHVQCPRHVRFAFVSCIAHILTFCLLRMICWPIGGLRWYCFLSVQPHVHCFSWSTESVTIGLYYHNFKVSIRYLHGINTLFVTHLVIWIISQCSFSCNNNEQKKGDSKSALSLWNTDVNCNSVHIKLLGFLPVCSCILKRFDTENCHMASNRELFQGVLSYKSSR